LEKLLLRRQRVHNLSSDLNVKEVLSFISERALPTLKPHLHAYQAKDLYELKLYGSKIELPQSAKPDAKKTFSGSKWGSKESPNSKETSPKPVVSEPKAMEKPPYMTSKKVEENNESPKPIKCTFCTRYGHTADNCRSRAQAKKSIRPNLPTSRETGTGCRDPRIRRHPSPNTGSDSACPTNTNPHT
jgi:Mn-containing catalase